MNTRRTDMLLASFLDPRLIYYEKRILTKEQVYHEMIKKICAHNTIPIPQDELYQLLMERDRESSTAYSTGIAIPHIRLSGFEDTVIGMCWLSNPIDYNGQEVSWIVLIISDKTSSKLYLNIVAALLKVSKDDALMPVLRHEHDGHGVLFALKKAEIKVKENLTIGDIMIRDVMRILPTASLREIGSVFNEKGYSVLPVTDEGGRYLGEVNILNLLKVGIPDYLMMIGNLDFLQNYEPLEQLFEDEDRVLVKQIMSTDNETVSSDASIIEAVFEMIQNNKRSICVVDHGKLVGMVTAMDIFRKIIKA